MLKLKLSLGIFFAAELRSGETNFVWIIDSICRALEGIIDMGRHVGCFFLFSEFFGDLKSRFLVGDLSCLSSVSSKYFMSFSTFSQIFIIFFAFSYMVGYFYGNNESC